MISAECIADHYCGPTQTCAPAGAGAGPGALAAAPPAAAPWAEATQRPSEAEAAARADAGAAMLHAAGDCSPAARGARVEATRVGVRPIPADGLPVLGRSATVDNLHFAVPHSRAPG